MKQNKQNQAVVDKVDAEGKAFDFLLYGESITQLIFRESKEEWAALFPPSQGWVGAPLGVSGNDVEDLTWRIIGGSERPKRAPRCIALLIGTNDVNAGVPVYKLKSYMDYLLQYIKAAFPSTKIILWKLLPRKGLVMAPANAAYLDLARKHNATWVTCGSNLNPSNPAVLYDGTHPTPTTQTLLLRCVAPTVYKLVGKGPRSPPPRRPPPRAPSKRT